MFRKNWEGEGCRRKTARYWAWSLISFWSDGLENTHAQEWTPWHCTGLAAPQERFNTDWSHVHTTHSGCPVHCSAFAYILL